MLTLYTAVHLADLRKMYDERVVANRAEWASERLVVALLESAEASAVRAVMRSPSEP